MLLLTPYLLNRRKLRFIEIKFRLTMDLGLNPELSGSHIFTLNQGDILRCLSMRLRALPGSLVWATS